MEYDIIGDDNSVVFFNIDRNTGLIRLTQSLFSESQTLYNVSFSPHRTDLFKVYLDNLTVVKPTFCCQIQTVLFEKQVLLT